MTGVCSFYMLGFVFEGGSRRDESSRAEIQEPMKRAFQVEWAVMWSEEWAMGEGRGGEEGPGRRGQGSGRPGRGAESSSASGAV